MTHVLAAVDLSDVSPAVIHEAEFIAKALSARLTLLHVCEPVPEFIAYGAGPPPVVEGLGGVADGQHAALEKLAAELRYRGVDANAMLLQGSTADTILEQADRRDSNLIVIGTHGRGMLYRALVGSVSAAVVRESRRPVLVVPDPRPARRGDE